MKKILVCCSAAMLAVVLMACGGQAEAAVPGAITYQTSDPTQVMSLGNVYSINNTAIPGQLSVTFASGLGTSYPDSTGALFNKILINNPQFVAIGGGTWVNPNGASRILCQSGKTLLARYNGPVDEIPDSCAVFNQIKLNSF